MTERHFLYGLRLGEAHPRLHGESDDLGELMAYVRRVGLKKVRILSPDDNSRQTADFWAMTTPWPEE